jgi:hypothetical protein
MATHDYVIANGTGAAVRSDLNNALAAIVSNNSSSSEPGTTYAYQWWADTNANVLKIRNSSNDGWITLRELDGTMLIEDGSASTPGLAFASDLDTGLFRSADNRLNFATGGTERLELGSSEAVFNEPSDDYDFRVESNNATHMLFVDAGNDRLGIRTSGPNEVIDARGAAVFSGDHSTAQNAYGTEHGIMLSSTSNLASIKAVSNGSNDVAIRFVPLNSGSGNEAARIDSNGRLLINHSSSRSVGSARIVQIEGTSNTTAGVSLLRNSDDANSPTINLGKSRGTSTGSNTVVQDGDGLGSIYFRAADGTDINSIAAAIDVGVDGTPGSNDTPGRIMFGTTADGSSSPTERMRIDSSGVVKLTQSGGNPRFGSLEASGDAFRLKAFSGNASHNATMQFFTGADSPSERMRIDSDGRLLVGTATSTYNATNETKLGVVITGDTSRGGIDITGYTGGSSTGTAPEINLNRSIGTTDGSVTALTAAPWHLGSINFSGSTGSNFSTAASIRAVSGSQAYTGSQSGGELRFSTVANSSTSLSERMRIDNAGNILLGCTSADGDSDPGVKVQDHANNPWLRIVGNESTGTNFFLSGYNTNATNNGYRFYVMFNGGIANFSGNNSNLSDEREKKNIVSLDSKWDKVKSWELKKFHYNEDADTDDLRYGVIAQQVEEHCPEVLTDWVKQSAKDAVLDGDGNVVTPAVPEVVRKGVKEQQMMWMAIKALQEAQARIETLEAKVAALEAG